METKNKDFTPPLRQADVSGSGIKWMLFFSGGSQSNYDRFYMAFICGIRVEKHTFRGGVKYAIGNIDDAKEKYKTEQELLNAMITHDR